MFFYKLSMKETNNNNNNRIESNALKVYAKLQNVDTK